MPLINDVEKFDILKNSRACIFTTNFEGFGYPLIESFCSNTPTIHYDLPIFHETLLTKKISCPIRDAERLEAIAHEICNGDQFSKHQPKETTEFDQIKKYYSIKEYSVRIMSVLNDISKVQTYNIDHYSSGMMKEKMRS